RAMVMDFGIAKMADLSRSDLHLTRTGSIFGTPPYMSPEQVAGGEVNAKSDIYSLGCVLYEALTGARPFVGKSALETYAMHRTLVPERLNDVAPGFNYPTALEDLVAAMLEKNPDQRPATMQAVITALDGIWDSCQPSAVTPGVSAEPSYSAELFHSTEGGDDR